MVVGARAAILASPAEALHATGRGTRTQRGQTPINALNFFVFSDQMAYVLFSLQEAIMHPVRLASPLVATVLFALLADGAHAQQIYKWTDASGQVHYGEKKPENAAEAIPLDIAPSSSGPANKTDSAAEVARLNALSQQMASERQAAEQARQQQAIRDLEQENQKLKNDLLNQQIQQQQQQQQNDDNDNVILYPPSYPYPPYPPYPPKPYPPHPCQPWPNCHRPLPPPQPVEPPKPLAKPDRPFQPKPVGVDSGSPGAFRGR